jgi:predicted alpha/beta superfamily hydrolase
MTALKTTFLFCCTLLLATAQAQPKESIVIGTKEFLFSKILNEKREVWVHVPGNAKKNAATQRYPVVYVLDGEQHFHALSGLIHQLSATNGNTLCPEMIVVAVMNPNRPRDLTITHKTDGPFNDPEYFKHSGGGEAFTSYIEKELIPHIDSLYPTAPYRTLVGHSLGGMIVVNALLNHTDVFNAYVALDPSLWWDDNLLVRQAKTALQEKKFKGKTFFMAIANTMNSDKDTAYWLKDSTPWSLPLRDALELAHLAQASTQSGLRAGHAYYKRESHQSVPLMGEYDALRFIFDFHPFAVANRLFEPGFAADSALTAHYKMLSSKMGYTMLPPEALVNDLAHMFLEMKMLDKAESVIRLNLHNYPQSAVVHAAMGDLYAAKGDVTTALSHYKKSLSLKNDPELRKRMNDLAKK